MSRIDKKKIINKLNEMINNYNELSAFCNELSNDIETVIKTISKVIKYAFIKKDFVSEHSSLYITLLELQGIQELDKMYKESLNKPTLSLFKRKSIDKNIFTIPLDDDIEFGDIKELKLPTKEELEEICKYNMTKSKLEEDKRQKQFNYYKEQKGFEKIGFEYTRPELITIDSSFVYCGMNLSGNVDEDYHKMYNDDRYGSINKEANPLNNAYYNNIETIKKNKDISVRKLGNLYEIKNGRHRLIYILYNGKTATIPVKVTKRIEDEETNIILDILQKKYNIIVCKNNLLNDEPNLLLITNAMLYEIKNKNELKTFYNNLINEKTNECFMHIKFNIINHTNRQKIIERYKELIFKRYLSVGPKLLTINFTEAIKYFDGEANSLFYEAFSSMQYEYQCSLVYDYNFNETYRSVSTISEDNVISVADTKKHAK